MKLKLCNNIICVLSKVFENLKEFLSQRKIFVFYYGLVIIRLIFLSLILYIKFLRGRFPKDIPFDLTEQGFYILFFICVIYFYIILRLIKPKNPWPILIVTIHFLTIPLRILDSAIKDNSFFRPYYEKIAYKKGNPYSEQAQINRVQDAHNNLKKAVHFIKNKDKNLYKEIKERVNEFNKNNDIKERYE